MFHHITNNMTTTTLTAEQIKTVLHNAIASKAVGEAFDALHGEIMDAITDELRSVVGDDEGLIDQLTDQLITENIKLACEYTL